MSGVEITVPDDVSFGGIMALPLAVWYAMPTIDSGHWDNLKYDGPRFRVWISRMTRRDYGEGREGDLAYMNERMTVEELRGGVWTRLDRYGNPEAR